MKIILTIGKVDNKFNKTTAQINLAMSNGIIKKTVWLYAETDLKEGEVIEITKEQLDSMKLERVQSKSNPDRFFNVLSL